MQSAKLSVKELNKVLTSTGSSNNERTLYLGTFSEVDIVFVAGLFLQYMQHKDNWTKIPCLFDLTENKHAPHYFKQIKELYGVNCYQIFDKFPMSNIAASEWASSFAPPIYITNKSIDHFFNYTGNNLKEKWESLFDLKEIYRNHFDISDFVDVRFKTFTTKKQKFREYATEIQLRLDTVSPIFVFIFIVTCKKIAQKEDRTFEETRDYIEKIWQFTQEYVRGLYELAKNIVEHSGQGENDGQGMITIRSYMDNEIDDKMRELETHVFDYGDTGIIPTLRRYTDKKIKKDEELSEDSQKRVNDAYKKDSVTLEKGFTIDDFIKEKALEQQNFRYISHYGINKLYKIIKDPLDGDMFIVSKGIRGEQELFKHVYSQEHSNDSTESPDMLYKGTHYFFRIPFKAENFGKIEASVRPKKPQELSTQNSSDALQELMQKEIIKDIDLNNLNEKSKGLADNSILDIRINIPVNKQCFDTILTRLACLSELNSSIVIALNLEECSIGGESDLLRFLSYLTEEHKQSFVIYNLDFDVYKQMIDDNKAFAETRSWDSFWSDTKGMLVYTKVRAKDGDKVKDFFFADVLYGKTLANYYFINKILGNTFPNSASIVDVEIADKSSDINIQLPNFFYKNALLPYATLLKYKDRSLSLINIETIIQNDLLRKELLVDKEKYSSREIIEGYVNNIEGYHISDTHFKIGNKVHSEDFYYAKRLFQNSFYTTHLAMYIAIMIKNRIKGTDQKITLIGYEMYSELILSLIENNLKKIGWKEQEKEEKINHFIAQSQRGKLAFLPKDTFDDYIGNYLDRATIMIVPIAATGSTASKIENRIKNTIRKKVKDEEKKKGTADQQAESIADKEKEQYRFHTTYNIILAQDDREGIFQDEINSDSKQESIIHLKPTWYKIKNCPRCSTSANRPLFDTDNSSLTPSLIFGNPAGKTKSDNEVDGINFDELDFDSSLEYKNISRNDNYRIYAVDSDKFIDANRGKIIGWLKNVKKYLEEEIEDKLKSTDYVVIVAPCHESNSKFINIINEYVFSSSATIIHHQKGVDFVENFSLLNRNYLKDKNTKIFYVDDSLITGSHFFELFDLTRNVKGEYPLTASILLNDQAVPFVHDYAVRCSKNYFAFVTYNQPPTLNVFTNRPLEHECIRYESLQKYVLHEVLQEHFYQKAQKLVPGKNDPQKEESTEKRTRRLKMFEATHKIYDYFTESEATVPNLLDEIKRNEFVGFKLKIKDIKEDEESDRNQKALLKVLSQYPFVLYKELREKTFEWLNELIENVVKSHIDHSPFVVDKDYSNFSTFKFLLRRAAFLDNYRVLEPDFLKKLSIWFEKIDAAIENLKEELETRKDEILELEKGLLDLEKKQSQDLFSTEESPRQAIKFKKQECDEFKKEVDNLHDFPIFVLGNYIEMTQRNGWVAYHLLNAVNEKRADFEQSTQGRQFYNMLNIEASSVINDFVKMISDDYHFTWRDMYKGKEPKLYTSTDEIVKFFVDKVPLLKTNKFLVIKEMFFDNSDDCINTKDTPLINYLWIKQFLFADCIAKGSHLPKEIKYQEKIEEIIRKMKGFFPESDVRVFFIVTDGQQKPHVISQENNLLSDFVEDVANLDKNGETDNFRTKTIIEFLKGKRCKTGNADETTAEFVFNDDSGKWENIYTNKDDVKLDFLPSETKWLYLIRISDLTDKDGNSIFETQGLLGFYSKDKNLKDHFLPKQLLMLLREDLSSFIDKHHKNDEFSLWIQQKERNKYIIRLNHGVQTYENTIRYLFESPYKKNLENNVKTFLEYLVKKMDLISQLNTDNQGRCEYIKIGEIKKEFNEKYRLLFSLPMPTRKRIEEKDLDSLVKFNVNFPNLNNEYSFPANSYKDVVFEILLNIRKYGIGDSTFTSTDQMVINITIEDVRGLLFLTISNTYKGDLDRFEDTNRDDEPHGIDLLKQLWHSHDLGKVDVIPPTIDNNVFKLLIQLKRI